MYIYIYIYTEDGLDYDTLFARIDDLIIKTLLSIEGQVKKGDVYICKYIYLAY